MSRHRIVRAVALLVSCSLWALLPDSVRAQDDAGGFVDPAQIPPRPPVVDIEPIYRGPTIDTLATVRARGTLRVGVAMSDPMVMHDADGELIGLSVDIARRLADDIGVGVEFVRTAWSQIIPDLLDRRYDVIIAGLWTTPTRALVINYSDPTSTEGVYLIANATLASGMTQLSDFDRASVKIAVYADSIQERLARRFFPHAELIRVEGDALQLDPVLSGEAHAALIPVMSPRPLVDGLPGRLSLPVAEPLSATSTAMGVRKGDPDFLNYLNTWLRFQHEDGWLDERRQFWAQSTDWVH